MYICHQSRCVCGLEKMYWRQIDHTTIMAYLLRARAKALAWQIKKFAYLKPFINKYLAILRALARSFNDNWFLPEWRARCHSSAVLIPL